MIKNKIFFLTLLLAQAGALCSTSGIKTASIVQEPSVQAVLAHLSLLKHLLAQLTQHAQKHDLTSWKKIKTVSTSSASEFLSETEAIQAEFGCKVDIQQNRVTVANQALIAQNTPDHLLALFEQDISGVVSKQPTKILDLEPAEVAAFSKNGRYLATAHESGIKIWDVHRAELRYIIGGRAVSLTFSPDSNYVACMDKNGVVDVRETKTGRLISQFANGYASGIIAFSRDNKYILCKSDVWKKRAASEPFRLQLWENK